MASLLVVALLLLVATLLLPFVALKYGDIPSYLVVNSRPEAHLHYPGSRVVGIEIRGESPAMEGDPIPAHAVARLASSTSPSQVLSWYRDYLTHHGWTEIGAGSFRRGSEVFQIDQSVPGQYRVVYAVKQCRIGGTSCVGF